MPPKTKQSDSKTSADREAALEAKRRRKRASPSLLQAHTPPDTVQIPTSLRKCDGADIVKRNTSRKKKYIFIFPGALSLPAAGGKIGSLTSLDTRNPILNIEFPSGTLRLLGTLVFPQNTFLSVKPAKRAVQVIDVFETMIVFSEWRWLGDVTSNPGGLPVPLPSALKSPEEDLWRSASPDAKPSGEGSDNVHISSGGESPALVDSDEGGWVAATTERAAPLRSNPRRKGRVVNYSQLEEDDSNNDGAESSDRAATHMDKSIKRQITMPQDMDDSVQIIEDVDVEVKPGRAPRKRKRRRLDYSGESEEEVEGDSLLERTAGSPNDARILQVDDSVELVEPVRPEQEEVRTRRGSRRRRRTIKYSQESGDEYMEGEDDEGDKDFAIDAHDHGLDVVELE